MPLAAEQITTVACETNLIPTSHHTHEAKILEKLYLSPFFFLFSYKINLGGLAAAAFFPRKSLKASNERENLKGADNKKRKNINKEGKL